MTSNRTASLFHAFTAAEPLMWLLAGLPTLAALAARTLRVVGEDERLVVHRLGRAAGVRGPGLVVVWPLMERAVRVSLRLTYLGLFAEEPVTRDGVTAQVRATAVAAADDPARYATAADDPPPATAIAAEAELREELGHRDPAGLRPGHPRRPDPAPRGSSAPHGRRHPAVNITHTHVPGDGSVHHCDTRRGDHLAVIVSAGGQRTLIVYDRQNPDTQLVALELDQPEADQLADLLHSRPLADRLAAVEQRLESLLHNARR